jgi:hypothetical protein
MSAFLKVKGLGGRSLRPPLLLYVLFGVIKQFSRPVPIHTGRGGGAWTREKVEGELVYKRGRKIPIGLSLSPVYKQVKTTFRVWCLYSYLFDVYNDCSDTGVKFSTSIFMVEVAIRYRRLNKA